MNSISFIINGTGVTQQDIDLLAKKLNQNQVGAPAEIEYLVYQTKKTALSTLNRFISVLYPTKSNISPLRKAVASASGNQLVFTTINNILSDTGNAMNQQVGQLQNYQVAVPVTIGPLAKKIGVRRLQHVPFVIMNKQFVLSSLDDVDILGSLIILSDKNLALKLITQTLPMYPDSIIDSLVFFRPYERIAIKKMKEISARVARYRKNRMDIRLRSNVQDVVFTTLMPVFIICRDRLEPLVKLVDWLEKEGMKNIILIDNNSTYPPLLTYLLKTPHEVIRLNVNAGHTAPWSMGIVDVYAKDSAFIVSDPDIIPSEKAHGAVKLFCELLTKYPERTKVGFGLRIDDIPDSYDLKEHVIAWEKPFWVSTVEKDVYDAEIDTTFAVYRQHTPYTLGPGLRTGGRYIAQHEPWYINSANVSDDITYYRNHADKTIGSWGINAADVSITYVNYKLKSGDFSHD